MYQNTTLLLINMYNNYMSIKEQTSKQNTHTEPQILGSRLIWVTGEETR